MLYYVHSTDTKRNFEDHLRRHDIPARPVQQDRGQGPCFRAVRDDRKDVRSPMDDLPFAPSEILGGANYLLDSHLHPDHFTKEHLVGSCARTG